MKKSITDINKNLIKIKDYFIDLEKIEGNYEANELSLSELINDLKDMVYIIDESISKSILDSYPLQIRLQINSHLENILRQLNSFTGGYTNQNQFNQVVNIFDTFRTYILTIGLELRLQKIPLLDDQLESLNKFKKEYLGLRSKYRYIDRYHKKSNKFLEDIAQKKSNIDQADEEVLVIHTKIKNTRNIIEADADQTRSLKEQASQYSQNISTFDTKIQDMEERYQKIMIETSQLKNKNMEYQNTIDKLLKKAVSAGLFHAFNDRKDQLGESFWKWFLMVVGSTLLLVVALVLMPIFIPLSESGNNVELVLTYLTRVGIISSLATLVYQTTREFNREKKLHEEYAFKSVVSLSLEAYRNILNNNTNNDSSTKLIADTVSDLFKSPRELYHKFPSKDDESISIKDIDTVKQIFEKISEITLQDKNK